MDLLGDAYQAAVCDGIEQGAIHAGANLLFFVGGALPLHPDAGEQRHRVYELAGRHNLDGLILLSSTLSHDVGQAGVRDFSKQFAGLPLCSVGMPLPDAPSVTVDNGAGMLSVVRHIVEQHAAKRIAFISGPAANNESMIRTEAFRSVLAEHSLPLDEHLVLPGSFTVESGALAVQKLAARLGSQFTHLDAIVAANDNMALGAMDELTKMNVPVPNRVMVTGFDDVDEAYLAEPSLTTVRQPLQRMGVEAVRRVLQAPASGGDLEMRINMELVLRQSCRCSSRAAGVPNRTAGTTQRFHIAFMGQRGRILTQLVRAGRGRLASAGSGWEENLLSALVDDLVSGERDKFITLIDRILARLRADRVDINSIGDVITSLRDELVPLLHGEPERQQHAEDLFHLARLATSAAMQRGLGRAHIELTRWARTIAVVCNRLASARGLGALQERIRAHLPQLGVRRCFVVVYDNEASSQNARLVISHDASATHQDFNGKPFRRQELLPGLFDSSGRERCFAVFPLLGASAPMGHILFEYTAQHAFSCGVLADAISVGVRTAVEGGP